MSKPIILLVDDTKLFLELEKSFLKCSSARVLTAGNGRDALEIIRKEKPDLIYMDLHMPEMGGAECCATLKADPLLRSIPVIMVTSAGKEADILLCKEAGCDEFLTKPVNRRLFLEKGRRFLDNLCRNETRVPCRARARFSANNLQYSGVSVDISRWGLYLATEYSLEVKTPLEISLTLPEGDITLTGIKGVVTWQNSGADRVKPGLPQGFGVRFLNLDDDKLDIISAFIAKVNAGN
ncbi:MAG: response regulator [Deltaproteobacteria bacterium]